MGETRYQIIDDTTVLQERYFHADGHIVECAGPYLVTGTLVFDQPGIALPTAQPGFSASGQRHFHWLMPPWSIFHYHCQDTHVQSRVHIYRVTQPENWNRCDGPVLQSCRPVRDLPRTQAALSAWLEMFERGQPLYSEASLAPVARICKKAIENHRSYHITVSAIARQLGFNQTVMGRAFKAAFNLTPKQYQNRLRIIQSIAHMLDGLPPTDAGFEAGFNDLSRFYKQFKKIADAAPKQYMVQSKNAKTPTSF